MKSTRGEAATLIVLVLALVGGVIYVLKPKALHGESQRAAASGEATKRLEDATTAQGASVAASVTSIGRANADAPPSPARDFIGREIPYMLAKLPPADAIALLEAEKRRSAMMEGRAAEADRLYGLEAKRAAALQTERDMALAKRQAADAALAEAAAANLAIERRSALQTAGLVLLALGWAYTKLFSISPTSLGNAAAAIRAGSNPIEAIGHATAPWLHSRIHKAARLATDIDAPPKP